MLDSLNDELQRDDVLLEKSDLKIEYSKELPDKYVNLLNDEEKIRQIFSNLVMNAIKFSFTGTIRFGYIHKNAELECFVEDQGIGISEENKGLIFKQFRQLEGSLNRQFGGAGISEPSGESVPDRFKNLFS